jgi:hypothetical protein
MGQSTQGDKLRILVLEDYAFIACQLADELQLLGQEVLGPFCSLEEVYLNEAPFDAALMDIAIARDVSFDLASSLRRRGVSVVFYSGMEKHRLPLDLDKVPWHPKPSPTSALLDSLWAEHRRLATRTDIVAMLPALRRYAVEHVGQRLLADSLVAQVLEEAIEKARRGCDFEPQKWLGTRLAVACREWRHHH